MLSRWFAAAAAGSMAAILAASIHTVPAWAEAPPTPCDGHSLTVESWTSSDDGIYTATVDTPAIYSPAESPEVDLRLNIYFPATYDHARPEGYPVLYLLHGGTQRYSGWADDGDVAGLVARSGYPGIVVMPEGGRVSFYSNWKSNTNGGFRPLWEDFHVDQLVPWVDENFNTDATKEGRAIAGLSMGGFGALTYAGRHSDIFGSMASFSGGTDINATPDDDPNTPGNKSGEEILDNAFVNLGASIADQGVVDPLGEYRLPGATREERLTEVFGPRSTWPALNPQDLAEDGKYAPLSGHMALYTGSDDGDYEIGRWNTILHETLADQGVEHRFCKLPGDHSWNYWKIHAEHYMSTLAGKDVPTCPSTTYP